MHRILKPFIPVNVRIFIASDAALIIGCIGNLSMHLLIIIINIGCGIMGENNAFTILDKIQNRIYLMCLIRYILVRIIESNNQHLNIT